METNSNNKINTLEIINIKKSFKLTKKEQESKKLTSPYLKAVDNLSFKVKSGEIFGLLGPNGAGKTTALRMISSLISLDEGKILFNDKDIKDDLFSYRKKVGFLTSELKLDDFFTPSYTFFYMSSLYGINKEEIIKRRDYLFSLFEINDFKDIKIKDLSTGMKQKVSLAISLAHNPDIIIFDEPTNGLDIIASKEVLNYLLKLKSENKIIIVSSHIFSLIEKICDRVLIIFNGKYQKEIDLNMSKDKSIEDIFFKIYEDYYSNNKDYLYK